MLLDHRSRRVDERADAAMQRLARGDDGGDDDQPQHEGQAAAVLADEAVLHAL
jgi:hypothetical protein